MAWTFTEVSKEEFMRIKKMLLDCINSGLDAKNSCSLSVFAIPAQKSRNEPSGVII